MWFFLLEHEHQLQRLRRDLRQTTKRAFAMQTWSNLRTQIRAYFLFSLFFGLVALPASLENACLYVQFLSRSFKSPQSIRNYLSGLKFMHVLLGFECSFSGSYVMSLVFRGIDKTLCHVPQRATPITPDILVQVARVVRMHDVMDVSSMCAAMFLFFLMARAGNIFVRSEHGIVIGLLRRDVVLLDDMLLVTFHRTKVIQFGRRVLQVPLLPIPGSPLCPVTVYKRMVQLMPANPSDPLFSLGSKGVAVPLSKQAFLSHFRALVGRAGGPAPHRFSCPSFRRGGASWAFRIGMPGELIQVYGDWASECYKLYLDVSMDSKYLFARAIKSSMLLL